jgi:transposase
VVQIVRLEFSGDEHENGKAAARVGIECGGEQSTGRGTRRHKTSQALALRSRIILACAEKVPNKEVARRLRITKSTVGKWRSRFVKRRLDGLLDEPRPGAPRKIDDARVERLIATKLNERPRDATHWSTRTLARKIKLSQSTISRVWRAFGLQPAASG